ncbi:MAG TPA: DUF1367 family protein [Gammaproteobacteria bacterium]|nr:DUF1367 family protein [Gammaproteobacteria bacterium]
MIRTPDGFRPNSLEDAELIKRWKIGDVARLNLTKPRNYENHKRYFALLDIAFDHWEPEITEHKGFPVEKNRERFRKDIAIAAGYYTHNVNAITGDLRLDAKSIAFGKMDEIEFNKLFSKTIDVVLKYILTNYTRDDIDRVVNEIVGFS